MPSRDPSPVPVLLVVLSAITIAVVGVEGLMVAQPSWWMTGLALGAVLVGALAVLFAIALQLDVRDDYAEPRAEAPAPAAPATPEPVADRHTARRRRGAQVPSRPRSRA
jgi:hypothetical protein